MSDNGVVAPTRAPRAGSEVAATVLRRHIEGLKRALLTAELALADLDPDALRAAEAPGATPDDTLTTLLEERPDVARDIRDRVLSPLFEDPDKTRRRLRLETVAAWLAADGDTERAGEMMHCHRNTVCNRLHAVQCATGRKLSRPAGLVEVTLAMKAHELIRRAT